MTVPPEHHGGDGTPLLLLHGFTDTWRAWTPLLGELERHHEVLAPTLPGHHGGSPFPEGVAMSVDLTVDMIIERMDEAGWETAHIAGNSYGGWLALELAVRGRARSVVGTCPAGGWEHGSKEAKHVYGYFERTHRTLPLGRPLFRTIATRPRLRKLALREVIAHPERVPPRAAMDMLEGAAGCAVVTEGIAMGRQEGSWSDLGEIDCPVRLAYGARDWLIPWPGHYARLKRILPDAEYVELTDCGHLPMWDDPAQVARAILGVTQRVDAATPAPGGVSDENQGPGTWRLLVAMGLASGITSVPNVAIALALPTLHREFDTSTTVLQWTVTGYLLAYSSLLIAAGRLADLFGRVRVLIVGTVLFMAASVAGALADSAIALIVALVVAGVGAAVLTPASLAIVTDAFRGARRGMAVGVWGAATALFSGVGPAIGGVFTGELDWRWILWLNVIVGAAILLGVRGTRETRNDADGRDFDTIGLVTSVGALAALMLALNESPGEWAWGSTQTIVVLAAALALAVGFVVTERRVPTPLVDLAMFARRNLTGAIVALVVLNFALGAVLFFLPVYLQELLDYDPLQTGLLLLPTSAGMVIAMPIGGRLHDRIGPVLPIVGGMAISAVAMLLLSGIGEGTRYADLWLPLALLGVGVGAALTPLNLAALGAVSQRHHAAIGGILATVGGVGAMFGVAASGALFEALQLDRTIDQAREHGIALSRSAAAQLDGLLAGTPSASSALDAFPAAQQDAVREAVRDGFLSALGTTMSLSFAIVVVGIGLTLALIRRRPPVPD